MALPCRFLLGICVILSLNLARAGEGTDDSRRADDGTGVARTFEVTVKRNVMAPMRDGTRLATDLYIPTEDGRPLSDIPAVLLRTPYGKASWGPGISRFFAEHGYLSAAQDVRGRFESEGVFGSVNQEAKDGYDAIEWLARHPLCNGRVGTQGPSYMTATQLAAATQHPPSLAAMIPHHHVLSEYRENTFPGGALRLSQLSWVLERAATSKEIKDFPWAATAMGKMCAFDRFTQWTVRTPWRRGETILQVTPLYEEMLMELAFEHPDYDDYWRQPGRAKDEHLEAMPDIPILWVGGWLDFFPGPMIEGYRRMVAMGRQNQALLVGPWRHWSFDTSAGDVNYGALGGGLTSRQQFLELEVKWFDRWLKGRKDADTGAPVQLFVMGGGDGRKADNGRLNHGGYWHMRETWPTQGVRKTAFHLNKDGTLSTEAPSAASSHTTYTYDPHDIVRGFGGFEAPNHPWVIWDELRPTQPQSSPADLPALPGPGVPATIRKDVLWYQTAPLREDLTIAGDVTAVLWVSSTAPDTDFVVKLLDIHPPTADYPTGYALLLSNGLLRARYREGFATPKPMAPGKVYRLEIPIDPVANRFRAGHRIAVHISSSNFPDSDINRNTGGDPSDRRWQTADNTIHHDREHPSHIVLLLWDEPERK